MAPSNADGGGALAALIAYSHSPLRHRQLASPRTSCGRGYSRHAFSAVTLAPHSVSSALSKAEAQPREQQACQGSASLGFEPCGTRVVELLRLLLGSHRLKLRRCLLHRRPRSEREGLHEEQDSETSESERPRPRRAWQGAREQDERARRVGAGC